MHPQSIKVLHVTDSDTVVSGVSNDFILHLLPTDK